MTHGAKDWSKYRTGSVTYSLEDLAETAARLGSIVTYDRRGDVIFLESFEDGLVHVETATSGTGGSVGVDTTTAKTSAQCAKLTAGSDGYKTATVVKRFHPSGSYRIGAEVSWAVVPSASTIDLGLMYLPRGTYHYGVLRYDTSVHSVQYQDENGVYQDLETGMYIYSHSKLWVSMKLVCDFTLHEYVRVLFGNLSYDMEGIPLRSSYTSAGPYFYTHCELTGPGGTNPAIFLDDVIITQDEPS